MSRWGTPSSERRRATRPPSLPVDPVMAMEGVGMGGDLLREASAPRACWHPGGRIASFARWRMASECPTPAGVARSQDWRSLPSLTPLGRSLRGPIRFDGRIRLAFCLVRACDFRLRSSNWPGGPDTEATPMTRQVLLFAMLLAPAALAAETTVFKLTGKIPQGQFSRYGPADGADGVFFPAALSTNPGEGLIVSYSSYTYDNQRGQIRCMGGGTFPMSSVTVTGGTMRFSFTSTGFCFDQLGNFTQVPSFTWAGTFTLSTAGVLTNFESNGNPTSTSFPTPCIRFRGFCAAITRNTGHFVQQAANFVGSVGSVSVEAAADTSNGTWTVRSGSATVTYVRQL